MMNAKEAAAMTNNCINNISANHIKNIEDIICDRASKGYTNAYYSNSIYSADSRVKASIWQTLQEAGFKIRWREAQLYISWGEA